MRTTPGRFTTTRGALPVLCALALVVAGAVPAVAAFDQSPVKTGRVYEWLPAADDGYFAWSQNSLARPRHTDYFAEPTGESAYKVNPQGTFGYGGGIDGTTLIYQQVNGRRTDSDLKLWDLTSKTSSNPPGVNSSLWEWSPTISGDWVLFGRNKFARPSSPWRVILFNTSTLEMRRLDSVPYRCRCIYPEQVRGDYATWTKCTGSRCQVFLHTISSSTTQRIPNPYDRYQYSSSLASDGIVYFVRSGNACGAKVKIIAWTSGGPDAGTVIAAIPSGRDIYQMYTYTDGSGLDHVYFDRFSCRAAQSDIYVLDEQSGGRPVSRSPGSETPGSGPRARPTEAAEP